MANLTYALSQALNRASSVYRAGNLVEAERICQQIIVAKPDFFDAFHLLAVVQSRLGKPDMALATYDQALKLRPAHAEALYNRGNTLNQLKRFDEALASYDRALKTRPDFAEALLNRGYVMHQQDRFEEALESYDRALKLRPDYAEALSNRGNTLKELKRLEEALESYDRALKLRPDYAEALSNRGSTLNGLKRFEEALESYDRAIKLRPDYAEAFYNRGVTLHELMRLDDALANYEKAIALKPNYADAFHNRGDTLHQLKRFEEALASFDMALAIKPDHRYAFGGKADSALKTCDWTRTTKIAGEISAHVVERKSIVSPFTLLGYCDDPSVALQCARQYIQDKVAAPPTPLWNGAQRRHDTIRVAYLSADFHRHATAYLMAELFELHDRSRLEVLGISFGADDNSDVRSRLINSFDQFHDVQSRNDRDVAKLVNELEVDIAVDL